jgi:hypothetical protein
MPRVRLTLPVALVVFVAGGLAGSLGIAVVQAHGGGASLVHACVNNGSGSVRIVSPSGTCHPNETALDWNQQGETGPQGAPGLSGYQIVSVVENDALPVNGDAHLVAECPEGKKVLGGGYVAPSVLDTAPLSRPDGDGAWRVDFHSNGGSGAISVYAICALVD